jgi:hypothetical protein
MAEFEVEGRITFDSTQATTALKNVGQSAKEAEKRSEALSKAIEGSKSSVGEFGSALGLAGQAAGRLSPALGGIISVAGSATGVIQGLTTAGLGPLGVALAAVSVGVTAAIGLWDALSGAQKNASNETESLTRSIYRAADAYDELAARRKRQDEQTAIRRRIGLGIGSAEETDIERQRIQERLNVLSATNFREENTREIARLEQQLATLEENVRVVAALGPAPSETQAAQAAQPSERRRRGGGGGRRAAASGTGRPTLEQLMAQASGGGALALEGLDMETLGRDPEAMAIANADKGADIEQQRYLEQLDRNRAYLEAREAQEKEAADRLQAINDSVFQALESAFSSSVNAWLDGSMSMGEAALDMVKNVAKSLASEAIIQGLKQTALGLSALAVGSPTAAGHFAAAGKWAAVGVAAGVVGAASGAFGGGGGGGGAGPAAATGGPALTAGANAGAGTTVVINWGSSGLVYAADRAQLGRDISGMISEAHGRLGRGM